MTITRPVLIRWAIILAAIAGAVAYGAVRLENWQLRSRISAEQGARFAAQGMVEALKRNPLTIAHEIVPDTGVSLPDLGAGATTEPINLDEWLAELPTSEQGEPALPSSDPAVLPPVIGSTSGPAGTPPAAPAPTLLSVDVQFAASLTSKGGLWGKFAVTGILDRGGEVSTKMIPIRDTTIAVSPELAAVLRRGANRPRRIAVTPRSPREWRTGFGAGIGLCRGAEGVTACGALIYGIQF